MRSNWKRASGALVVLLLAFACGPTTRVFHDREAGGAPSAEGGAAGASAGEAGASGATEAGAAGQGTAGVPDVIGQEGQTHGGNGGAGGSGGAAQSSGGAGKSSSGGAAQAGASGAGKAGSGGAASCPGECEANKVDSQEQACGSCNTGHQTRSRTCSSTCTWGAWSAWSACGDVTAECEPNHYTCCAPGAWMWCYEDTCEWTGNCDAAGCAASADCTC